MSKSKKEATPQKNSSLLIGFICVMIIVLVALLAYIIVDKVSAYKEEKKLMEDFREYVKRDDISIIYYMHTGCQFCELEEPILERIAADYKLEYFTVDSSKLTTNDNKEVIGTLEIEGNTPTIVILKDGEIKAIQVGYLEGYRLVEFFIKAEVLDEGSTYKPEENLTFLEYEEFQELIDSEDVHALVLGTSTCEFCKAAKPILSNLSKAYEFPIYYFGLDYLPRDNSFKEELTEMGYNQESFVKEGKISTPALLLIKDRKIIATLEGYQYSEDYVKFFKENKIITE